MNDKIVVIEDSKTSFANSYNCLQVEFNSQSKDEDIHRWLIANKQLMSNAEKLIIPVRLGNEDAEFMGLHIGLHIRLTKELEILRHIPILFISDQTSEQILTNQLSKHKEKSGLLIFTRGTYLLSALLLDEYIYKTISPISNIDLNELVIPNLIIESSKDSGHKLANEWGSLRLAKFAGHDLMINKPYSLFFKYKDSLSNNEIVPDTVNIIGLHNESCRALLIDDSADKGWSEILKFILRNRIINPAKAISLDIIKSYEDANYFTDYEKYDIIFLDLRLKEEEDQPNSIGEITEFSGSKILKKIKDKNRGIQVVIFTASNKVWNIEKLLANGANGYYIKESPEYVLSSKFSKDNYLELLLTINNCLKLKFLKQVVEIQNRCYHFIASDPRTSSRDLQDFYLRTIAALEIAFDLLEKTIKDEKYFNFAFLTYFQILEDYTTIRNNFDFVSNKECYVGSTRIRVIDNSTGINIWKLTYIKDRANGGFFKIAEEVNTQDVPVNTLAKISFILAFKFNKDDNYLKKWGQINNVRNTKAGHGGSGSYVSISEINWLLEIIELFLTNQ